MATKQAWEVCAWSESSALSEAFLTANWGSGPAFYTLISGSAIESSDDDRITVVRIVGDVLLLGHRGSAAATDIVLVKERIHVGFERDVVGVPTPVGSDSWTANDAGDEFLWERTRTAYPAAPGPAGLALGALDTAIPYTYHVDVRVQRRLEPPFCLLYSLAVDPSAPVNGDSVSAWGWLRALVRR